METHTPVGKRRPSGKWDHRPLRAGVFLTFEGIDCSGKSIQASRMHDQLKKLGFPVMLIRDPGGTVISEKIRSLLLDRSHHAMDPLTEMFLYEAARTQMVAEIIKPALTRNEIVLCDRFTDSTICYQGYGRG